MSNLTPGDAGPNAGRKPRVLIISVFHPAIIKGGAQQVAHDLYTAAMEDSSVDVYLLSAIDTNARPDLQKSGAVITGVKGEVNSFFLLMPQFDYFWQSVTDPIILDRVEAFLDWLKPDVVHFHHSLYIGVEVLAITRAKLPQARILYTFHEFIPICHANGQMVKSGKASLCYGSSPIACHECFRDVPADLFLTRERWFKHHYQLVDHFITPTSFIRQRYVEWGIPEEKISVISNGQNYALEKQSPAKPTRGYNRFAFFGQFINNKGVHVLLEAAKSLVVDQGYTDFTIDIFGGNLEFAFEGYKERIEGLISDLEKEGFKNLHFHGEYSHEELATLMAGIDWVVVTSTWWEIFCLVVSEAWYFRKPVIVSDVGGLAERVTHMKDGLKFPVGNARALAQCIRDCCDNGRLHAKLVKGITPPPSYQEIWSIHKQLMPDTIAP